MNQVARVLKRPVEESPDASQMTAAAMCPEALARPILQNQRQVNNQHAELATCNHSENLSLGSLESVFMRTASALGNSHCYRDWPPAPLIKSAVSLESLDLDPYQDRSSCFAVVQPQLNRPVNIFDKRHVPQTPHDAELQEAAAVVAHAQAYGLSDSTDRLDPYRARSLPTEAAASQHVNGFNSNNRRRRQQQQQQQQQDCLPRNYEWPSARLRSRDDDSLTSSWRPSRLDQASPELGLCHFDVQPPPPRRRGPSPASNIATSDLPNQAQFCSQTFDQQQHNRFLVPFDASRGAGVDLSPSAEAAARLNCACLDCYRRQPHFELHAPQIASDSLEDNEFCCQQGPMGPLAPAHDILVGLLGGQNWRSRSTTSISSDLANGLDTTICQQQQQPIHHQLENSRHSYGAAAAELYLFEFGPTNRHNVGADSSQSARVMSHLGQHQLCSPLHNLPALIQQDPRLGAMVAKQRASLLQQPPSSSNSVAQFQFRPQNQQPAPWSLPSSPVVGTAGQMGPRYYERRSIVQPTQVQRSHLSRWPAQKPPPPPPQPTSNNNDHKFVQNCRIGPEKYLAPAETGGGSGCSSTANGLNCQLKLPFDGGPPPADWEGASWHADQTQNRCYLSGSGDDDEEEEEEYGEDEEEAETLALVPSQAKGRLPMSVAEQMSEQASKFVQTHPSAGPSPAPHSSRRQTPAECFALSKQQSADQRRHRQQRQPSTRSRSLAGVASSERSDWAGGGGEQDSSNGLKVRRTLRVKVRKSKPILGIAIEGGFNVSGQLIPRIVCVHEKGAAYQCGKLRASDLILEVNGVSTVNMTHDQIAETIANAYYQDERPYIEFLIGESVQV